MANYFRITAYHPGEDYCFIVDSHGRFEKLWQFSSYLVNKGLKILEVSTEEKFLDDNMKRAKEHPEYLYIQSVQRGQPTKTAVTIDGKTYRAIEVCGRRYVPDRNEVVGQTAIS